MEKLLPFGDFLRSVRLFRRLDQADLKGEGGPSRDTVRLAERAELPSDVTADTFSRLASAYGFTNDELLNLWQMASLRHAKTKGQAAQVEKVVESVMLERLATSAIETKPHQRRGKLPPLTADQFAKEQAGAMRLGRHKVDPKNRIPLMNKAPAGGPHDFTDMDYVCGDAVVDWVDRGDIRDDLICEAITIVGDSMEPEYRHGDVVIIAAGIAIEPGSDCFIRFTEDAQKHRGECTVKRVTFDEETGTVVLSPLNQSGTHQIIITPRDSVRLFPIIEVRRKVGKLR